MAKAKKQPTPLFGNVTNTVDRVRGEVEGAAERFGRRAVSMLTEQQQDQVDKVIDSIGEVREDLNGRVDELREQIEERLDDVRTQLDKRVTGLRKETNGRRRELTSSAQKEARKLATRLAKWLKLPVRGDVDSVKRRLTAIERRIDSLEKGSRRKAAA
jgi:uncharacterized coiled-coil DUF342 family protein